MSNYKSVATLDELADLLEKRLPALAQTRSYDSSNNPCLLIGAAATTNPGAFIRITPESTLQYDSVGHAQTVFVPNVIDIAWEASPAGATNTFVYTLPVLAEAALRGHKVRVWEETSGTPPSVTTFSTPAKLIATFNPHIYFPMLIGQ